MKVAFGFKAHSGWAALVVLTKLNGELHVIDRQRVELVGEEWMKQPYHAAEHLKPQLARNRVKRGIESARSTAAKQMRNLIKHERERNNEVVASAVLIAEPMPNWSTDEILAVHFRMHKAEGVLFRDVLVKATNESGIKLVAIPEKSLQAIAEKQLGLTSPAISSTIAALGKSVGPPWGKDQKESAIAAWIGLETASASNSKPTGRE